MHLRERVARPHGFASLVLAAFLAALLSACGGGGGHGPAVPAATPTPARPDPDALVSAAADRLEKVRSFHFVLDHENGGSPIVLDLTMKRAEGDMVKPDQLHASVEATAKVIGKVNVKTEVISVGDKAEIQNPFAHSNWVPLPGQNPLAELFDPSAGAIAALRSGRNLELTGEDAIGGKPVWVVQGDIDAASLKDLTSVAEAGYTVKGTVWIGKDDPLLYRVRLEGPLGGDDDKEIVRKIELSRFDQPVAIKLP